VTPADAPRPRDLLAALKRVGVRVAVAVPDSWIGGLMDVLEREPGMTLVRATHEEEALAIACGARLGGARPALLIQNAGLLTSGAGLTMLALRYQVPLLVLACYRGAPDDPVYYHVPKGRVTEPVLRGLGLGYAVADRHAPLGPQVEAAAGWAEAAAAPFVLLLRREDVRW
jgi:sulfopyruvate decarboxylase subunit alpha